MNYRKLMEPYFYQMGIALQKFVAINSVYDETTRTKEMPFGKGVNEALRYAGYLGERFGFKVDYCDGYATELTLGNKGKLIGIYAHSDVVPISGEWKHDPFDCVLEEDGNYYGRGTSDDKGPLIAALYAVKALNDNGLLNDVTIRFVIGGDEERGSGCLEHYFEVMHKPYPDYGFTPDSDFPVIYGEKGIINFYSKVKVNAPEVLSFKGGVVFNAVCESMEVRVKNPKELAKFLDSKNVKYKLEGDVLTFLGKTAHGSTPEAGINAGLIGLSMLGEFYDIPEFKKIGDDLDNNGKKFGGYYHTELLGDTTYCVGILEYKDGELTIVTNFRHPEGVDPKEVVKAFDAHLGLKSELGEHSPHLLMDPNSELVKTLVDAYRKETGDMTPPFTIGGGTYARHAKNTLAFGAMFPGTISTMHEPNERFSKHDFELSAIIYARAIHALAKLK